MSLIRSFIPEDDNGNPRPVSGRAFARTPSSSQTDQPPLGVIRPTVPHLAIGMALELIRPTLTFNTGERYIGVPWRKIAGVLNVMIRVDDRAIYVPIHCLRPMAARHDHLFPHWKRPQRRAA